MDRPSGILRRHDMNKYDAFDDADFADVLEGITYCNGELCTECSKIDFAAIFDFLKPKFPLSTSLNNALQQSSTCVFCCAIATAASKRPALLEAAQSRKLECDIRSWQHGRLDDHKYPYLELVVHVKSSKNPDDVPWLPERVRDTGIQTCANAELDFIVDDPLLVLELTSTEPGDSNISGLKDEMAATTTEGNEYQDNAAEISSADSDDTDFETAYVQRISAAWRSRRSRVPLGSKIDFSLLKARIKKFCTTDHPSVSPEPEQRMAGAGSTLSRLIEASRLRLINVLTGHVEIIQEPQRYVALSYVCGRSPLKSGTLIRSTASLTYPIAWSINWKLVPKSIRDARQFVHQLGERYLWVDSLCIDQDDKEDKRAVIAEMMSIYGCADVTLAAVAGTDGHHGLPGVYENSRRPDTRLCFPSFGKEVCLVPKRPSCFAEVQRSTWNTRAWTCQEYLLSQRLIFITEVETFIVVGNDLFGERFLDYPIATRSTTPEFTTDNSKSFITKLTAHEALIKSAPPSWSHYGNCLVTYSQRRLTYLEDRLAAFLGIFNRFCDESCIGEPQIMLSGLPYQWFYPSLLWEHPLHTARPERIRFDIIQSRAPPSWSWIGWDGPVSLHENRLTSKRKTVKVQILDKFNIMSDSLTLGNLNSWPFEPSPCPADSNDCTTLHLWATRIQLYLRQYKGPVYRIEQRDKVIPGAGYIGNIWLDPHTAAVYCNDKAQDFIIFDQYVMLVQKKDYFYERRGIGSLM